MEEAWKKFEATGSVMDYLRFKEIEAESRLRRDGAGMELGNERDGTKDCSDRNGLKRDAYWRL